MRLNVFYIVFLLVPLTGLLGQSGSRAARNVDPLRRLMDQPDDQVRIEADSLLVVNYYKHIDQNKQISGVPGYRIRIFSDSGIGAKEEQQRVRARFLSLYPGVDAYYHYDEPFFKVYVGDCRTKSEALKLYDRVKNQFPNPILVEDYIRIKNIH
ncbi:MAG TPA: SPOR domain-containing protein [Bacteroides sp.]|nr:SPOR domain-containing protein [Bacteroides sp.]